MKLKTWLSQYENIAWYPSADRDAGPAMLVAQAYREDPTRDWPDCFVFTDYHTYEEYDPHGEFFLERAIREHCPTRFAADDEGTDVEFWPLARLENIQVSFHEELVDFEKSRFYGRVYTGLLLFVVDGKVHPIPFAYAIAENTAFALEYLIPNRIQVKWLFHLCYGQGFGGGRSSGHVLAHLFKDLGVRYYVKEAVSGEHSDPAVSFDPADTYLSPAQRNLIPVIAYRFALGKGERWDAECHEVMGFEPTDWDELDPDRPHRHYQQWN